MCPCEYQQPGENKAFQEGVSLKSLSGVSIFSEEGEGSGRIKSTPAFVAHIPHRVCAPMTTGPSLRNKEWLSPSDEGGQEHFCKHACLQNDKAFIHDFSR